MFKQTTEEREKARVRQAARRAARTPEKIDAEKKAERHRFAEFRKNNRQRIRENQNAKGARIAAHYKERDRRGEFKRTSGMSVVTREEIQIDTTRWRGPGAAREARLDKTATDILKKARTPAPAVPMPPGIPDERVHTPVRTKRELWPTGRERPAWQ